MSDADLTFAPLSVPEIQPKELNLPANRSRLPGGMVHSTASAPAPITASRLEIGGTWVQKVEFPVFEATEGEMESEPEPAPEKPVVIKAAGDSAQAHPVLSPLRPAYKNPARGDRRKPGMPQRIPVLHPSAAREAIPTSIPGETVELPLSQEAVLRIREAKTDPRRVAKIESCFTRLLPPDIATGSPLPTTPS